MPPGWTRIRLHRTRTCIYPTIVGMFYPIKLSVENKETGDNYSSTVLEYDPEAKELKGKDGGSSFRLDDGTNIRKLASEIFNRTETMDL